MTLDALLDTIEVVLSPNVYCRFSIVTQSLTTLSKMLLIIFEAVGQFGTEPNASTFTFLKILMTNF